jgi:hypothetical protein
MDCHFAMFDDATAKTPIVSAPCGELVHFATGSRAAEVTLQLGQLVRRLRLPSEHFDGARIETHETAIPFARLRVTHEIKESPGVTQCAITLTSEGLPVAAGTDDKYFDIFAGTYDATFICQATEGVRSPTVMGIEVLPEQEKEVRVAILAPAEEAPGDVAAAAPAPVIAAPTPAPGAPSTVMYALPGAPVQQGAAPDYGNENP